MEGCRSKCNHCIHVLLGYSHFPSCAFKSECESRTLGLLQRFVGLVLLELFELSSCAFSQSGNYFARVVLVMMLLTSISEKQRSNISTDRLGMAPKWGTEICVLIRFGTYRFHRYRCHVGTGFRYPTLLERRLTVHSGSPSRIQLPSDWTGWCRRCRGFVCMHFPRSHCSRESWREFAGTGFYYFSLPRGGRAEYGSQI